MPAVTGSVRDIVGSSMAAKEVQLIFTLNGPNVVATGSSAGRVFPTEPEVINPASDEFSVNLAATTNMIDDAWYTLQVRWLGADAGATLIDFPDWQIRVPGDGGPLADLIGGIGGIIGGSNRRIVWVSLTPPPRPRRFQLWLEQDPDNPDSAASTSDLYEWR